MLAATLFFLSANHRKSVSPLGRKAQWASIPKKRKKFHHEGARQLW
jgi:hypothetical protein